MLIPIALAAMTAHAQVRLVPIAEGWAKNQVNAVIFRKNSVTSHLDHQYAAFYDGDSNVIVAKRKLSSTSWAISKTGFTGNTADAHNSISLAVDGRGFLHLAWGNHNTKLNYARSAKPETPQSFIRSPMIGSKEDRVSYPDFYSAPSVSATVQNVLPCACDIKLRYQHRDNDSDGFFSDYNAEQVSLSLLARF